MALVGLTFSKIVRVGDWGRITHGRRGLLFWRKNGTFVRESNIYEDVKAANYGIPDPVEYGRESEGETWITSQNATQVDASLSAGGTQLSLTQCTMKGAFKFSSGRGAILAMKNAMITIIDPPGALKRLFEDPSMRGVVAAPSHSACKSSLAPGRRVDKRDHDLGSKCRFREFQIPGEQDGECAFYTLVRLVSLVEEETSTGIGRMSKNGFSVSAVQLQAASEIHLALE
ncbi:hypothetical protein B0H19DRAFT_1248829 [Mycena capillaripes]|nr:hypothetical protein B0H19DRAFT_1248829 [Mycena capillaripes]